VGRILNIVETAYRTATLEPRDAVLEWTRSLKGAGADVSVLLRGSAVNYAVSGPHMDEAVKALAEQGVTLYAVREDARDRGLDPGRIVAGIEFLSRSDLADLIEKHDHIWYW
jgi:sulfur relay protein TusB/DsrH